ncbi:MAG: hypothetical protein AAGF92_01320 [Myxococcota bacterium]
MPKQVEYWARLGQELERRRHAMQRIDPMIGMTEPPPCRVKFEFEDVES